MKVQDLKVAVVDDNVFKSMEIKRALEFNGILNITLLNNQEDVWNLLDREDVDLIVTDMHYPLEKGAEADIHAGFILLEKLKEKGIQIPVIICSTINYQSEDAIGTVWYNKMKDLNFEFKEMLDRVMEKYHI
ncbi:MAG: response regulator [Roseburia sp.]